MRVLITAWLLFLLSCGSGMPVHAQGIEWETLNDEAMTLYRQGRYDRAVVVAKKALQVTIHSLPDVIRSSHFRNRCLSTNYADGEQRHAHR